jgi:tetratricopeptide (TPR) repeat protein
VSAPPSLRWSLGLSLGLSLLSSCTLTPSSDAAAAVEPLSPAAEPQASALDSPQARAQFHVMAGEMAAGRQQPRLAAQEFLKALQDSPDAKLASRATALALAANDEALALEAARRWLQLDSTSLEARQIITRLALRAGRDDEAYAQCAAIVRDHPGGIDDGLRAVALLLTQEPGHQQAALALMHKLVAQYPKQAGAYQALSLLALSFDQPQQAESAARSALALKPQSKEAALLLVGALVKKGDVDGADQVMEGLLRNDADADALRLGYARLLLDADHHDRARAQLDKILKHDPKNADALQTLGTLILSERKPDEAQSYFERLARLPGHQADAEYFLGRIAELRRQPAQALEHYEKVDSGAQALDAEVRRAAMLGKLGRLDEARTLMEELREQYPPLAERFLLAEGEILVEAGAYEQALQLYDQALEQQPDDDDLRYSRSLLYERMNRIADAEADLRAILQKSPDDARALNALGYTLAVHTDRLDEADQLVGKALAQTPDDPAIIDSLGWVRFRQGRLQEALSLLQKAYAQFPDPEVAAHLSEVLWDLGQKDQARALWTKAQKDDPDNPILRETIKRLGGS